jgi:hypothetical protein
MFQLKNFEGHNTLKNNNLPRAYPIKSFWEPSVTKLFTGLIYYFPRMPFQPSLMFAGKAGAYPSEALFKGHYRQNLDKLEKTYTQVYYKHS